MKMRTITRQVLRSIGGAPLLREFNKSRKGNGPEDGGSERRSFVRGELAKAQKARARRG